MKIKETGRWEIVWGTRKEGNNKLRYVTVCNGKCTLFQKLRGGAGSKRYGMDFSLSYEEKEETPRNYNGLRVRERKNTFHITLNQRQLLSFGTVHGGGGGGGCPPPPLPHQQATVSWQVQKA